MPDWTGFTDESGSPHLEISVGGQNETRVFNALIDTGFNGFIMMSIFDAIPLGFVLGGTINITLADGNAFAKITVKGTVTVGGESQVGTIILEPNPTGVLIGMDFLRIFKECLLFIRINP